MVYTEQLPVMNAVGVEPPQSLKDDGWGGGDYPAAAHFNWFFHRAYKVLEELQQESASTEWVTQQIAAIDIALIDSYTSTDKTKAPTADALRLGLLQKLDKSRLISTRSRIYHDVASMNISTTLSGAIAVTFPSSASGVRVTLSIRAATGSDYWRLMVSLIIPSISTAPVNGLLTAAEGSYPAGVTVSAGRSNGQIVVLIGDLNSTWYGGMQVFVDDVAAFGSSAPTLDGGVWALSSYTSSSTVITPDITATPGKPVTTADAVNWQKWAITTEFGTAQSITNVDLNNYKRDGRYYGANLTNAPSSGYYFIEVMAFNDYNIRQIARSADGLTYQERFFKGVGGSWSPWSNNLFALQNIQIGTTASVTYYVDGTAGSDTNNGTSTSTAFKTIQKAVDTLWDLCKGKLNHNCAIYVKDSITYAEEVVISSFYGRGLLTIQGNYSGTLKASVNNISVYSCTCAEVGLYFFNITSTTRHGLYVVSSSGIRFSQCTITTSSASFYGVMFEYSVGQLLSNQISNRIIAILSTNGSTIFSISNSGSGNSTGLYADRAATIGKSSTQPSATTAETQSNGGVIR